MTSTIKWETSNAVPSDVEPITNDASQTAPEQELPHVEVPIDQVAEKQAYADLIAFMKQHADPGTDIQHLSLDEFMDGLE